jgi:hypothetical protein
LVDQREERLLAPFRVIEAPIAARQPGLCAGLGVAGARADTILTKHGFPEAQAILPQPFLRLGSGERHLAIPAFDQRDQLGGIGVMRGRVRSAALLVGLEIEPHRLHALHDLGPMHATSRG